MSLSTSFESASLLPTTFGNMTMFDLRYHHYNVITGTYRKWSTDWHRFPGVPVIFWYEEMFLKTGLHIHRWMRDNWHHSLWTATVYLILIYSLRQLMVDRKPFDLRRPMAAWSCSLAMFSMLGAVRCLPELVYVLVNKGLAMSYCDGSYYEDFRVNIWYWMFVMSKVLELGDTIFIVLRKQRLHHFHVVHHSLTLCYCWFVFADVPATARWMVNMNFVVHSLLYGYLTLKALRFKVPRRFAALVTISEIAQLLVGFYINISAFLVKTSGGACDLSMSVATAGFGLYSLLFVLFVEYFLRQFVGQLFAQRRSNSNKTIAEDHNHSKPLPVCGRRQLG